jgi:trigger factor
MTTEEALQTQEKQEFKNSLVSFTFQSKPKCILECSISATKELIEKAKEKATKSIAKQVSLPGFRKGKAPESQILQRFPKEVESETKNTAMRLATLESINLGSLPALDKARLEDPSKDPDMKFQMESFSNDEMKFRSSFEIAPSVPAVDPSLFNLKQVTRQPVGEEQIAERIRQALFFTATWNPVTDRPVQENDFVLLDVKIKEDDSLLFQDTRFEVTDKSMAKWMKEAIIGKNTGDVIEATSVADEDLPAEEKEVFQPKEVTITIKLTETPTLPELTESFLKSLGVQSEEELRSQIEKMLTQEADMQEKEALSDQVLDFLVTTYPFDLPESLVVQEARFRFQELSKDPKFMQEWDSSSDEDKKKLANLVTTQSTKAMQIFYLCRRLIQDKNIPLAPKEGKTDNPAVGHFSQLAIEKASEYIVANAGNS